VGLYFTPVSLIGCANRGLIALGVVLISLVVGLVVALSAIRSRRNGDTDSGWLAVSALILAIPAVLVLGPLG